MKKTGVLIVLLLIMTGMLLCGCGKDEILKDDPAQEVKLVWYSIGPTPEDLPMVMEAVNKYTKEKLNATVDLKFLDWGDYDNKIQTICSAGEKFDLMLTCSWVNKYPLAVAHGYLMPLDKLLPEYGKDMLGTIIDPQAEEVCRIKGQLYAINYATVMATMDNYLVDKDMASKYGIDYRSVKKLADWGPLFAKLQAQNPNIKGLGVDSNHHQFMHQYDFIVDCTTPGAVRMEDSGCKVVNQFEDKDFVDMLKTYREFYKKGYIRTDAFTIDFATLNRDFDSGRTLVVYQGDVWNCADNQPYEPIGFSQMHKMPVALQPCSERPVITTSTATASMTGIAATSEHPARAMRFLSLLNTDPYLRNLIGYGIEGVHWKKVGDKQIELLPRSAKYQVVNSGLGSYVNVYSTSKPDTSKGDGITLAKRINEHSTKSPLLGFYFDSAPVKNELAAIANLYREFLPALFVGAVDTDSTIKSYLDKARTCGMDKIIAEMQKQIDEWKKTKK